nr:IncP plasmid survival protein KfrC family protein [Achromobacter xylosoxidans]
MQPASAGFATSTTSRTDAAGDALLAAAEATEAEQQAALEAAPLDQTYQEALALYVQAKHDQVERIEDRLENLIDRQQARLQQTQANQPGLLSRPGAKRAWQNQQMQQQARLQSLHVRLEAVREIKEGMGLHSPKVEELATRKMRAEKPELAADWDAMREAARRHQALQRREEQERKQAQALERPGRSQSLGLTRPV